jgi:phospholipid/cholesterol/gamma-HCH transport system substrate-binding protein
MRRRMIREYGVTMVAIVGLMLAAAVVGGYILVHQRITIPGQDRYTIDVELPTAQAITPGQGQMVSVSGVTVGRVKDVTLRNGRAVVKLDIERAELPAVYADATALTRPRTPLDDMSVELDPGTAKAGKLADGGLIPVSRSQPNVNVDEVLAGLDGDTRPALQALLKGVGEGVGSGDAPLNLRRLLKTTRPTLVRTKTLTDAIRGRRVELRRLVSNLAKLTGRLGDQTGDLQTLVSAGNQTFGALAAEDGAVRASLAKLPGTLQQADSALAAATPLARTLKPALAALTPAAKALPGTLAAVRPLAREGTPDLRQLRGLSTEAQPLAATLNQTVRALRPIVPNLIKATGTLQYVVNELAYNPAGKEEGYLFWLDWFAHNTNSMLSSRDANGGWWRGLVVASCSNVDLYGLLSPVLAPLAAAGVCPK